MDNDSIVYKQIEIENNEMPIDIKEAKAIIEALLFTAGEALSLDDISRVIQLDKKSIKVMIDEMIDEFNFDRRGIQIIQFNDKYQLATREEHAEYIKRLLKPHGKQSLSRAALETIAIIAYRQPVTRQAIDFIRGVKCDRVLANLVEKRLIKDAGRLDSPGRPILYETTDEFLKYFGLESINELPKLEEFNEIIEQESACSEDNY